MGSHPKLFSRFGLNLKSLWPGQSIKQQASCTIFIFGLSSFFFGTYLYVSIYIVKNICDQPALGVVAECTSILGTWFESQHKILIFFLKLMTAGIVASMNG
jgi:hypothetical protein